MKRPGCGDEVVREQMDCGTHGVAIARRIASVLQSMLPVDGLPNVLPIYVFLKPSVGVKRVSAALFRTGEPAIPVFGLARACEHMNADPFLVPVGVRADRGMAEEEQRLQ